MKMQYDNQARIWEEALPLGNGRIGAMVWSGVGVERLSLNDDTLWSGYPKAANTEDKSHHFVKARDLAMKGRYHESQEYIEAHMLGAFTQSYLPLGELVLEMSDGGSFSEYSRFLDLDRAVAGVTYRQGGVDYKRECFISAPDQVLVMKISADRPGSISFTARFTCRLRSAVTALGRCLRLEGIAPSDVRPNYSMGDNPVVYESDPAKQGMRFIGIADFEVSGGTINTEGESLYVDSADQVIIRFCYRTSYKGVSFENEVRAS